MACEMGGPPGSFAPPPTPIIDLTDDADDRVMGRLATINISLSRPVELSPRPRLTLGQQLRQNRSSSINTSTSTDAEVVLGIKKRCASCNVEVPFFSAGKVLVDLNQRTSTRKVLILVVYAPCGHDYCKDCIIRLFSLATREESLFPPRCCKQSIPLAAADVFFSSNFIKNFEEKSVEFSTVNRVYCAWPTCSVFIPPSHINGDTAVCPTCGFWVCTICKGPPHHGRDCPEDTALSSLIQTARQAGWQRCYRCRRVVELAHGCNHMTWVRPCPSWLCML